MNFENFIIGWTSFFMQRQKKTQKTRLKDHILCCCCSATKSCLTLCDPMDYSTLGSSDLCYLQDFAQIHIH